MAGVMKSKIHESIMEIKGREFDQTIDNSHINKHPDEYKSKLSVGK